MASQKCLDLGAPSALHRVELRDHLAPPDNREVFASVLHGVEDVEEVSGCVSCAHFRHTIRFSDYALSFARPRDHSRNYLGGKRNAPSRRMFSPLR